MRVLDARLDRPDRGDADRRAELQRAIEYRANRARHRRRARAEDRDAIRANISA